MLKHSVPGNCVAAASQLRSRGSQARRRTGARLCCDAASTSVIAGVWACKSWESEAAVKKIPRTNINCTETVSRRPPERAARAFEADRVWEIDTGHDLMITEPTAVAELLLRLTSL